MKTNSIHRALPFAVLALAGIACSSAPTADPSEAKAQAQVTADDEDLVKEAHDSADVRSKLDYLEGVGWARPDFSAAKIEHHQGGASVVVRLTRDGAKAAVDLLYTLDEAGARMVLLRPDGAASAKVLAESLDPEGSQADEGVSEAELAKIVPDVEAPEAAAPLAVLPCGHIRPGQSLYAGQTLTSCHNGYRLAMQGDGNLVLYIGSAPTWSSRTNGKGGYRATMQGDGNFVVYTRANHAVWATGHLRAGDSMVLQDDGNLVKETGSSVTWATGTNCESGCVGVCKSWSCGYISKVGLNAACRSSDDPYAEYFYKTLRWGHTIPGFCGTGTYADYRGYGIACPVTHSLSIFFCGTPP
jgi:hypothetical protein